MKQLCWIFLIVAFGASAPAVPSEAVKSYKITFKIKNAGITVDGSFSDLKADIRFDPKNLDKSTLQASIGVATVNTGIKKRDTDLKQSKYFHVEKYPRIKMISKKLKDTGKGKYKGTFDLTIRDVTKEVDIPFTYSTEKGVDTFKGSFTIDRRDFKVGSNSIILSDDVTVFIEVSTQER